MKKSEPFVALPRAVFDTTLWNEPRPFTRMEAYIDLLQSASYHPSPTIRSAAGRTINIHCGETIAATRYLSERWKWPRANVRTFIHSLERLALVNIRTEKRLIVISIPSLTDTTPDDTTQTFTNQLHNVCTSNDFIINHLDTVTNPSSCPTTFTNLAQNKEEEKKEKQLCLITADENNDEKNEAAAPSDQEAAPNILQAAHENQEADPSEVKKSETADTPNTRAAEPENQAAPKIREATAKKPRKNVPFRRPNTDEIAAYCREKGFTDVDPEAFYDYYEAKGWVIGRSPMRDWHAALRGWHRREAANPHRYPPLPTEGLFSQSENTSLLKAHTLPLPTNTCPTGENTIYHANHPSLPLPPHANRRPPYPQRAFSPDPFRPSADASGRSAIEAVRALEMRRLGCIARMDEEEPIF